MTLIPMSYVLHVMTENTGHFRDFLTIKGGYFKAFKKAVLKVWKSPSPFLYMPYPTLKFKHLSTLCPGTKVSFLSRQAVPHLHPSFNDWVVENIPRRRDLHQQSTSTAAAKLGNRALIYPIHTAHVTQHLIPRHASNHILLQKQMILVSGVFIQWFMSNKHSTGHKTGAQFSRLTCH